MSYKPPRCLRCNKPLWTEPCVPLQVGDIFKAKATGPGGRRAGTRYWLIVCIPDSRAVHMLGLNKVGEIVSTTSYGHHTMHGRTKVGYMPLVKDFQQYLTKFDWPVD